MIQTKIDNFIKELSKIESNSSSTNLYYGDTEIASIRRNNLRTFLYKVASSNCKLLLLGEAPGHRGCGKTGIPFTCEYNIVNHPFFANSNFQTLNDKEHLERETSAMAIWEKLSEKEIYPLMWNIFPFHPHQEGNINSNRTPKAAEIRLGREIAKKLINIFEIETVLCIGRKAEAIRQLKIFKSCEYIIHPARGKASKFKEQIDKFL
ncbi:uracil-DNA glycosylase [Capnocytophaga leadbetteri]|uniref:uracil-DNA glycosylase n=1 Tax=Capnocytophaga leadbetteri TaxID=327575 RepID=UPI0026EB0315|nr:uracil-DNA glycosylase [Capnocytophaga leadbetteri]